MSEEVKFLAEIVIANMNVENSFNWHSVFKDLELKEFEGKAGQFLKVFPSPFYAFFKFHQKNAKTILCLFPTDILLMFKFFRKIVHNFSQYFSGKFFALSPNR